MFKTRFISMLVLLMTAVTGAWATITVTINQSDWGESGNSFTKDGVTVSATRINRNNFRLIDGGTFSTTLGNFTKIVVTAQDTGYNTGWNDGTWTGTPASTVSFDEIFASVTTIVCTIEPPTVAVTGVTLAPTSATLTLGETETVTLTPTVAPDNATDKSVTWSSSNEAVATVADGVVTAVAAGEATITVTTTDGAKTATCAVTVAAPAPATYTVTLKEGTEDATNWTITPAEATTTGVAAGTEVKATYGGTKKVKSVKAVKKAAPAPAGPTLTLGEMTQGGDPISGGSGSGTYYSPTFSAGQQVAVFYKNTSGQTVKVLSDALTASDISNEGKSATINVTIDDADKTQPVTYFYPATMAKDDGSINFNFTAQSGTEASLSTVRNCCKGSGAWDGNALPSVSMASQIAIWKLTMTYSHPGGIFPNKVFVKVDGNSVAETSDANAFDPAVVYLALDPATMGSGALRIEAYEYYPETYWGYYYEKAGGVSLTAGKYYQSSFEMGDL